MNWKINGILLILLVLVGHNPAAAQIRINEFVTNNESGLKDPDFQEYGDWIELYNTSGQTVSLNGMYLSDDPANLLKWAFPTSAQIPANGFLLVWADNKSSGIHTNFRLSYAGEYIALTSAMGIVMDSITYGLQVTNASYGRQPDGASTWAFYAVPTPGVSNSAQSGGLISPPPSFSVGRGFYAAPFQLTLSVPGGIGVIRYTLDGSDPTGFSNRYTTPISISKTSVVRARVYKDNETPSPIVTHTYLINEATQLPVFSITTDPVNLWDQDTGIYTEGRNYVWGWGNGNFWQDWEKEAFVEFFEQDRSVKINQSAGLKISGALSRTASQKSLRLIARRTYGEPKFDYWFFKNKSIKQFNDIKLRTSGNDWASTMMKDGTLQTMIAGQMDIDYQSYRPSIVFLNGDYWGIHNIREMINDDYIEDNHGFDKTNIDFLTQMGEIKEGDSKAYNDLIAYVRTKDMSVADNYAWVAERMDIQEYINYNAAQIYFANYDWPAGNIKYWRPRIPEGIFRWIIFDLDLAYDYVWHNTLEWATMENPPDYPGSTDLFKNLMKNSEFRTRFLNTLQAHLNSTFDSDRLIHIIDSCQTNIDNEMKTRHIARWVGEHGWTYSGPQGYIETGWLESYDKWLSNVEKLRFFARERPSFLNGFIKSFYGFEDPVKLTFSVSPNPSGRIVVNNSLIVPTTEEGTYFTNQDITLKAVPDPRFVLDKWEIRTNPLAVGQNYDLIPRLSTWKYLDTGVTPPSNWASAEYTDTWPEGCAILGYNDANACKNISFGTDPNNKHITYYFRKVFKIQAADQWSKLTVKLLRDDGAIVYLNGTEVVRSNMPAVSDHLTWASSGTDGDAESTYYEFEIPIALLRNGNNVIAVEVHQASPSSSDLSFDLSLVGLVGQTKTEIQYINSIEFTQKFQWPVEIIAHFRFDGAVPDLAINEVMTLNQSFHSDRLGSYSDWIEIYNNGNSEVNIGGLYMTDDFTNPGKWMITHVNPDETRIASKGFLVLYADERPVLGSTHLGFKITGTGESIGLSVKTSTGFTWIDTLTVPPLMPDISFGRFPDGANAWKTFQLAPTPGMTNKEDGQSGGEVVKLFPVYPNPFSDYLFIRFSVQEELPVYISIRDMNGNIVNILTNRSYRPGVYRLQWDGTSSQGYAMRPGIYVVSMTTPYTTDSYKALLIR